MVHHLSVHFSFRNFILPLTLITGLFLTAACQQTEEQHPPMVYQEPPPPPDTIQKITICAVGDLMCHSPQFRLAKVGKDTFDFRPCYAEVAPILQNADFTIGNLETNMAGKAAGYSGYPQFNTPDDYLDALEMCGFDFLVTSNNHSMDRGEKGLLRTLSKLDEYGFAHTGSHESQSDRDSVRVVDIDGITMAILNYTYGTNGLPTPEGKDWMVNRLDSALIEKDFAAARAKKPDLICVFFHFGLEYQHEPSPEQKKWVQHSIDLGADIILGSHPHAIQQADMYKTKNARLDSGFVIYSMGNFLSNQNRRYTTAGVIMQLELTKDLRNDSIYLSDVSYFPTFVYRGRHDSLKIHKILPAGKGLNDSSDYPFVDDATHKAMRQAYNDTRKYLNLYHQFPEMKMPKVPVKNEKLAKGGDVQLSQGKKKAKAPGAVKPLPEPHPKKTSGQ